MARLIQHCFPVLYSVQLLSRDNAHYWLLLSYLSTFAVSYSERSDYGAPDHQCSSCGAVFWYGERVAKDSRQSSGQIIYNSCCRGGKVVIPPFLPRPEPLASLARFDGGLVCNRFMKSI